MLTGSAKPCSPGRKSRKKTVKYDKRRYKRRTRIERMFRRLKDWRRVATRYDKSPTVFLAAIALAATVIFWLCVQSLGCGFENDLIDKITSAATFSKMKKHATQYAPSADREI